MSRTPARRPASGTVERLPHDPDRERLDRLARLLDEAFRIPGTRFRIGLDGLVGLVPGIGDAATTLVSLYLIAEARRLGAPGGVIGRMVWNELLDLGIGAVPVVGDLFDFAFKANRKNIRLLQRHLERSR